MKKWWLIKVKILRDFLWIIYFQIEQITQCSRKVLKSVCTNLTLTLIFTDIEPLSKWTNYNKLEDKKKNKQVQFEVNSLIANLTKWSNTLKQIVGKSR